MLLLALPALAQEATGFDAHGFTLRAFDGDPRDPLTVSRPGPWEQGDFWAAGVFEYADRPLVKVVSPSLGSDPDRTFVVLDQLVALNANAGVAVHDRVRLDVTAPVFFTSIGPDGYQNPSIGDIRATAMASILRPVHVVGGGGPGLGVEAHIDAPTGTSSHFLGQGGVAGGFAVSGTYEGPWYTFTAELGSQFNPEVALDNLVNSDQFVAGAAINVLPGPRTGITVESHLYAPFQASSVSGTGMPAEVLLSLRQQLNDGVGLVAGGAAGISEGASAARFRAFLGLGFGVLTPARQPDHDAVVTANVADRCPEGVETKNGWRDDDGCPDELGGLGVRVVYEGADVDDADLVVTGPDGSKRYVSVQRPEFKAVPGAKFDAKATVAARCLVGAASAAVGEASSELVVPLSPQWGGTGEVEVVDPAGAPVEGASIRWTSDAPSCVSPAAPTQAAVNLWRTPMGPGRHHLVVDAPGYKPAQRDLDVTADGVHLVVVMEPSKVVLEHTRIAILDKVYFEFNKSVILPQSYGLLDDVAAVILTHPEVGRIQVEGHTDDKGNDAYNLKLSQSRADSVKAFLVKDGVPAERLVAVGFGETRPIDTNATEDGRSQNRRVEFNLIDQVEPAPAGGAP